MGEVQLVLATLMVRLGHRGLAWTQEILLVDLIFFKVF